MITRLTGFLGVVALAGTLQTSGQVVSVASTDKVRDIRTAYQTIEKDSTLSKVSMGREEFLGDEAPDKGATLNGFFRGDTLCKVNVRIGMSYGVMEEHYFFSNGQLVFVYETEDDNGVKPARAFEGRYYFDKDNVIQQLTEGKKKMGPDDAHHYLELYHNGHYYASLLIKKRRSAAAHKPTPLAPVPARTT